MDRDGGRNYNRGRGGAALPRSGGDGGNRGGRGGNGGGGRGRGQRGGGRGGARAWGPHQQGQNQGGGGGGGGRGGGVRAWGPAQSGGQPWVDRAVQGGPVGGGSGGAYRPPWSASSVAGQSSSQPPIQPVPVSLKLPEQALPDIKELEISEKKPSPAILGSSDKKVVTMKRPDDGGTLAFRNTKLLANHFPVKFNPQSIIMHYDADIKPHMPPGSHAAKRPISKSDLCLITEKLFSDDPTRFPKLIFAYDGEKNIFSAVPLPTGTFYVELSGGEDTAPRSYRYTIELVNELKLSKLNPYLRGMLPSVPCEVLKDNPSRHMISVGRSFSSKEVRPNDDLGYGIAAFRGFQQMEPRSGNSSPPCDAIYKYLPFPFTLLQLMYNGKTVNPFEAHLAKIWTFLIAICIYHLAPGLFNQMQITCETSPQMEGYVTSIAGAISCISLVSLCLTSFLSQLILWVLFLPMILANILSNGFIIRFVDRLLANAIVWVRDNFNLQTIANSFDWVQNKFNSARRDQIQMLQQPSLSTASSSA